jgi:hypothetical protein
MRQLSTSLAKSTAKNCRIWGWEKPQEVWQHERDSPKLSFWCVIRKSCIIGPFFFDEGTDNIECYRTMLQDFLISELRQLNLLDKTFFQQDCAPCHLASNERQLWNHAFSDKSKGRAGPIAGPLCWMTTPLDPFFRGHVKKCVFIDTTFFGWTFGQDHKCYSWNQWAVTKEYFQHVTISVWRTYPKWWRLYWRLTIWTGVL